jgi:CDGSH-type Zn-finger protein
MMTSATQTSATSGIKVSRNGPYLVSGHVPLDEQVINVIGHHNELQPGSDLSQADNYALCRCGHSGHAPMCDGSHVKVHFEGTEVADRRDFADRPLKKVTGETMTLLDDERCAFSRFCHQEHGDVWSETEKDSDPVQRAEAIKGAAECIAGRLVMVDDSGDPIEKARTTRISIVQDPAKKVSGPLFVQGPIQVTSVAGEPYEVRNRQALCRCGGSENKPFCDATHVSIGYHDGRNTH